ncbi:MAG: ABC transporter substrate-binding protein [Mycobacteriaceae bacterium]|nr:ABC transporter substrate-binding protein [Mycobacteriaceae bacterium]NUT46473.1 ABC transporter substrate-binding protein [Saccharothrix sp.]
MTAHTTPGRTLRPTPRRRTGKLTIGAAAAAVALAVGLSACSPSSGSSDSGDTSAFTVARTGDIDKLDPQLATAFQTQQTLGLVYSSLVKTGADGSIQPDLATQWTTSQDNLTVTFSLRPGVTWHDGTPFTSEDVKASLQRILDQATGAVARSNLTAIASIDAPAPTQVVLHLSKPAAALLYSLASVNASIVSAKDIAAGTVGKVPDGTGPFAWKQWDQGQQVVLTGNAKYYGGAPAIDTLTFRVIPDEASILNGMKAGAFQIGQISDPGIAQQAGSGGPFNLVKQPALAYHTLMLNGRRGPLQNQQVRQAISCAIDRDQVLKTAAYGDGTVTGPITSPAFQYPATDGLPCRPGDVDAAKQMLAAAGFGGGFTLNTIVETGEYATAGAEAQNLQAQLAKIGVRLELRQLPTSPYVQAWLAADYDAAVALNGGSYDPYLMYGRYFGTGGSLSKPGGIESQALAGLLAQGNSTSDDAQRKSIYGNLQKQLLTESPWVWMFRSDDYYLVKSGVQGFTPRPDELLTSLAAVK